MVKEKLKSFKNQQPYKSVVVNNPWDEDVIDAEEVHAEPFEKVMEAVNVVKNTKKSSVFVLQGEPGSGKSHLLWRIAKNTEKEQFLFVNITPYVTVNGISFVTMLESTVESLQKKHPALKSKPIEHLIGWTIRKGLRNYKPADKTNSDTIMLETISSDKRLPYVAKYTFEGISKKRREKAEKLIRENLIKDYPKMPLYFINLLVKMLESENFKLVTDFLKGEKLPTEELKKLGLPGNFSLNEEVAFKILCALFNFSPFPFIISIDQIETLDYHLTKNKIREFFEKIAMLLYHSGNVMFLLSVQTQTFKKWEAFLPSHISDRLSTRTTIYPITLKDAKAIIRKRNAFYWKKIGVTPKNTLYPFKESEIEEIYYMGNKNPRRLIKVLDYLLDKGTIKTVEKRELPDEFQRYARTAKTENLRYELSDLFVKIFNGKVIKKTTTYFVIKINDTVFAVNNSKHSVYSCVKSLARILNCKKARNAVLFRKEGLKIRASAMKTKMFISKYDIRIYYYNEETAKDIVAISKILRDTESGDTELKIDEVKRFSAIKLKEIFHFIFEKDVNGKVNFRTESTADENNKKIKDFISKMKVTTKSKVIKNSGVSPKKAERILKELERKGKIRILKRGTDEEWIFNNEL